jgi:tetratricopeptide (TPR) repeat protein
MDLRATRRRRRQFGPFAAHRFLPRWVHASEIDPYAVLAGLVALSVLGSVLVIGAVHPPVMLTVGAAASAAFVLALRLRLGRLPATPALWPALTLAALAAFTAVQLVPLSLDCLRAIAPGNADVWERALLPFEEVPSYTPISLDPGATSLEAVRWLSYAGVYAGAAVLAAKRGPQFGLGLVFLSGVLAALATVGHGLVGATEVFGIYEPSFRPRPWHVGPLLNPNNLSAYLNLALFCGFGLVLHDQPHAPRWLHAVGIAVVLGVNVTAASRAGLAVLPVALLAFAITIEVARRRSVHTSAMLSRARGLLGATLALGLLLALLAGTKQIWHEIVDKNIEKLAMVGWLEEMASSFAWVGIGRGAFESVSPAFQPNKGGIVYTHAENFVLQWAIEWGIPVTLIALLVFGWQLRPGALGVGRNVMATGGWVGIVAVLLHNLLDLGLEVPALMLALSAVLGSLWGDRSRKIARKRQARIRRRSANIAVAGTGVVSLLVLTGAGLASMPDLAAERHALREQLLATKAPRTPETRNDLRARLREAMRRHPAEPYFPMVGGTLAWQEGDENPMPWLQRALERSLVNGRAHLLLAHVLMDIPARSQALLELRLAVDGDPRLVNVAAELALRWATSLDELLVAVPIGEARAQSLDSLGRMAKDRAIGVACDRLALETNPELIGPHARLAQDLIRELGSASGCDDRAACERELQSHIMAIEAANPDDSTAPRLRGQRLLALDQLDEAERYLAESCPKYRDGDRCSRARVEAAAKLEDRERLVAAGRALLSLVCVHKERCAETAVWLGDLHAGRSEWGAAIGNYERAARDNETPETLSKLAWAASRAGKHAQAARALERALALRGGNDPDLLKRLAEEREKLIRPTFGR